MTDFSAGEAGTAGLRLIVKQPLAVLAWSLIYLVLYGVPMGFYFWFFFNSIGPLTQQMAQAAAAGAPGFAPNNPEFMRSMAVIEMMYPLMLICMVASRGLVQSAICRAVLEPENRAWFYIRFGKRELWVALTGFVFVMLIGVAEFAGFAVIAIPAVIIGAIGHAVIGVGGWVIAAILGVAALIAFLAWLALRFSLCIPMSFADSEFRLGESWTLTKGRVGRLLLTGLIAALVAWLFETVVMCFAMAVVLAVVFGGHWTASNFPADGANPAAVFSAMAPIMVGAMVFMSLLIGPISAIILAPFAAVLKAIRPIPVP